MQQERDAVDRFMDGAHWALFFLEARLEDLPKESRSELERAIREVRTSIVRSRATRIMPEIHGKN